MRLFALSFVVWAGAVAAAACGGPETGLPSGLVAVPMLAPGVQATARPADAGADAALVRRPPR